MTDDVRPDPDQPEAKRHESARPEIEGPASDALAAEEAVRAAASDTFEQAADGLFESVHPAHDESAEAPVEPAPTSKLERLQKILAQAGIASRRHAEELITQGRVQVNGQVVTELGTRADAARDHIRVDGKLLQGSERLRYFMLNKPKGFVTTVSDPEGRPTIMQFFSRMRERLYPVGRLDYLSEGLLLVTNDGELANKLTRAASGVEKTYLVKVSGHPSEEDIDRLRRGVGIDRGKPGSGRVQTAPAEIREFRPGRAGSRRTGASSHSPDNPWYEVVLIEGRNRELRKMFEEIGHRVEKIRRIGYGPLVLDLEPGKLRELEPEEVDNLRKAAEGKYRKPKLRETRKPAGRREFLRPGAKPHWKQPGSETQQERARYPRPERSERRAESGGSRGSVRPSFSGRPRDEFRSKPRFEESRPQRPPRRGISDRPGARPNRASESGRSRDFASTPERRQFRAEGRNRFRPDNRTDARSERSGARPPRRENRERFDEARSPERGDRPKRFGSRPRPEFRERPEGRQRFEGRPQQRPGGSRSRDREDQPRFEAPRRDQSDRRKDRPARQERATGPRPGGGFRSGKRGAPGAKQGSIRSAGGRRSGPRPGGKPGKSHGGKRRD